MDDDKNNLSVVDKMEVIRKLFSEVSGADKSQAMRLMWQLITQVGGDMRGSHIQPDNISAALLNCTSDDSRNSHTINKPTSIECSMDSNVSTTLNQSLSSPVATASSDIDSNDKARRNSGRKCTAHVNYDILPDLCGNTRNSVIRPCRSSERSRPMKKRKYIFDQRSDDDDEMADTIGGEVDDKHLDPDYNGKHHTKRRYSTRTRQKGSTGKKLYHDIHSTSLPGSVEEDKTLEVGSRSLEDVELTSESSHSVKAKENHSCTCPICRSTFSCPNSLWLHSLEHGKLPVNATGRIGANPRVKKDESVGIANSRANVCKICGIRIANPDRYSKHMKNHEKFQCKQCTFSCTSYRRLNMHSISSHGVKAAQDLVHGCHDCGAKFANKRFLVLHKRIHTGEKPVECKLCGISFRTSKALAKHKMADSHRRLSGLPVMKRSHLCNLCGRSYSKKQMLLRHQRYHTGDRPHACPHCNFRCLEANNLKRHMTLHFDANRTYTCEICGSSFHAKNTLDAHKIYKHDISRPFKCPDCPQTFKVANALKRHSKTHMARKDHKCKQCGAEFNRLFNLRRHLRLLHGSDSDLPPVRRVSILDMEKIKTKTKTSKNQSQSSEPRDCSRLMEPAPISKNDFVPPLNATSNYHHLTNMSETFATFYTNSIESLEHEPSNNSSLMSSNILPHIYSATVSLPNNLCPGRPTNSDNPSVINSHLPQMPLIMSTHVKDSSVYNQNQVMPNNQFNIDSSQLHTVMSPGAYFHTQQINQPIILDIQGSNFTDYGILPQYGEMYIEQPTPVVIVTLSSINESREEIALGNNSISSKSAQQFTLEILNRSPVNNYSVQMISSEPDPNIL